MEERSLYRDKKIPKESISLILSNQLKQNCIYNYRKNRIHYTIYMDYFKIDTFLNITSINTDNNLNKEHHSCEIPTASLSVYAQ